MGCVLEAGTERGLQRHFPSQPRHQAGSSLWEMGANCCAEFSHREVPISQTATKNLAPQSSSEPGQQVQIQVPKAGAGGVGEGRPGRIQLKVHRGFPTRGSSSSPR